MTQSDGSFSIGSDVWPGASKVLEEIGELGQVLGKLIAAHGEVDHWDGTDLRERLHEEVADVRAALLFFTELNSFDRVRVMRRAAAKYALFVEWHQEGDPQLELANLVSGQEKDTSDG